MSSNTVPSTTQAAWPERDLVRVQASPIHGTGAFAKGPLARGTRIIQYKGQRFPKSELAAQAEGGGRQLTYVLNLDAEHAIDGAVGGNEARFVNHSCAPNCEIYIFDGVPWLYAMQDLPEGAELTFDYQLRSTTGVRLSAGLSRELFPCRCGAPSCRGTLVARPARRAKPRSPKQPSPSQP